MRHRRFAGVLGPLAVSLLALWVTGAGRGDQGAGSGPSPTVAAFLARRSSARVPYSAFRRLEAQNKRFDKAAWLEATTEFDPSRGFTVAITSKGGSGYILRRVLQPALEAEAAAYRSDPGRTALTSDNYEVRELGETEDGLVRLALKPLREETTLIDGEVFVTKPDARIVRVVGRTAKNPSFWTKRVDIVRSYELINGHNMAVELRSQADVRLAGKSEFRMTIRYEFVAGEPVESQGLTAVGVPP